jgi:hypothetical protein
VAAGFDTADEIVDTAVINFSRYWPTGMLRVTARNLCKRRSETVALDGACVTVEKRGALEPARGRASKTCGGITATSLTPPRGSRECTRTWSCGAKYVAGC